MYYIIPVLALYFIWIAYEAYTAPLMPDDYNLSDEEYKIYRDSLKDKRSNMKNILIWTIAIIMTIFLWPLIITMVLFGIYAIVGYLICAYIVAGIKAGMNYGDDDE